MKRMKRKKLEKAGWRIASPAEFLGLTPAENKFCSWASKLKLPKLHARADKRRQK